MIAYGMTSVYEQLGWAPMQEEKFNDWLEPFCMRFPQEQISNGMAEIDDQDQIVPFSRRYRDLIPYLKFFEDNFKQEEDAIWFHEPYQLINRQSITENGRRLYIRFCDTQGLNLFKLAFDE